MRVTASLILAVVVVTLAGCGSLSQLDPTGEPGPVWEQPVDGPYGGSIKALAVGAMGTLYAATQNGLFRYQPQHDAWTRASDTIAKTETVKSLLAERSKLAKQTRIPTSKHLEAIGRSRTELGLLRAATRRF